MQGFLIYEAVELERNRWFAEQCIAGATKRGHLLELKLAEQFSIGLKDEKPALWYNGQPCAAPDFAIVRSHDYWLTAQLESMGVRCFNNAHVCRICNDKALTHAYLAGKGVPMADTVYITPHLSLAKAPFLPAVVKAAGGHGGKQVFWVNTQEEYQKVCADLQPGHILVQRPAKTLGKDLRVYVLGNKVLAAVLRSNEADFRSNFSLGGRVEAVELTAAQQALVQKVLQHFDLDFAGIDFIFDGERILLNEIEDVVGSRMLYQTTNLDVVELYLNHIFKKLS